MIRKTTQYYFEEIKIDYLMISIKKSNRKIYFYDRYILENITNKFEYHHNKKNYEFNSKKLLDLLFMSYY